jgi:hypothetical protein
MGGTGASKVSLEGWLGEEVAVGENDGWMPSRLFR